MYIKLKNISLKPTIYGNDLVIKQVELRENNGTFVKHVKIDDDIKKVLHNIKIEI